MKDLRLTSPGLMLIVGVVLAAGIYLLDLFYLQPQVQSHQQAALKEQACRVEHETRLALQLAQNSLASSCHTWARTDKAQSLLNTAAPEACRDLLTRIVDTNNAEAVWVCDSSGKPIATWSAQTPDARSLAAALPAALQALGHKVEGPFSGLQRVKDKLAVFAQAPIGSAKSGGAAVLCVGKWVNEASVAATAANGVDLKFIPANALPTAPDSTATCAWQMAHENRDLLIAWKVCDPAGATLGYFESQLPVTQIYRQSVAARTMVLIVLALSMGLVLLIIMGTHILVAGPVVRLLRRLQQIESGKSAATELTHQLHGEPLVLARRLESVFERLAHQSKTDQLTGIANRRHFEEVLQCFYHQARRYSRPLSLLIMDVDNFKSANDTGGHQHGDEVLQMVTQEIERCCRKADLPARWGGDEFAVLMPETTCADATAVATRIAQSVKARSQQDPTGVRVSLSVGATDLNAGEIDSPQAMINLADRALYTAKEMGRDRVIQAHDLNGLTWPTSSENSRQVNLLRDKVAGLDSQIRDFFLHAVEEMLKLLRDRDPYMADQASRVRDLSLLLGEEMGLPNRVLQRMEMAAMLHDIGMISIPDSILQSAGPLNEQQLQVLHRHPLLSVRIMEGVRFLDQEIPPVRYHHERFDGSGYPEGLKGGEIPLTARILSVADAYVAMTSPRSFRAAKSAEQALSEIRTAAGTQFDPAVVDALLNVAAKAPEKLQHAVTVHEDAQANEFGAA